MSKATELKKKQLEAIKNFLVAMYNNIRGGVKFEVSRLAREMNVSYSDGIKTCLVRLKIIKYKQGNGCTKCVVELLKEGDPLTEDIKGVWSCLKKHNMKIYPRVKKSSYQLTKETDPSPVLPQNKPVTKRNLNKFKGALLGFKNIPDEDLLRELSARGYAGELKKETVIQLSDY